MPAPTRLRALGVSAAALALTAVALPGTADAEPLPRASVTAAASDTTPQSGQQFVVTGRLTGPAGAGLANGSVRVQTFRDGHYVNLTGARVTTGSDGRYRVRVVLSQSGERRLRVLANPAGDTLRNAHRPFTVHVG